MKLVADMFADPKGAEDGTEEPAAPAPPARVASPAAAPGREGRASRREASARPRPESEQLRLGQCAIDFAIAAMSGEISPNSGDFSQATPSHCRSTHGAATPDLSGAPRPEQQPPLPRRDSPLLARRDSPRRAESPAPAAAAPQAPRPQEAATPAAHLRLGLTELPAALVAGEVTPCRPFMASSTLTPKWSPPFRSRSEQRSPPLSAHPRADSPAQAEREHAAVVAEFEAVLGRLFPSSAVAVPQSSQHSDARPVATVVATPQRTQQRFATLSPSRPGSAHRPRHASPRHGSPDERGAGRVGRGLSERSTSWQSGAAWQHAAQLDGNYLSSIVEETFRAFCGAHRSLDGRSFAKLCRDCHLIDRRFTATDADLIFAKVVPSGLRRVDLAQFEMALRLIAEKKGLDECAVRRQVEQSKGPNLQATKADPVRFHDDRSTYTGTHVYGWPEPLAKGAGHQTPQPQLMFSSDPPKSWMPPPTWTRSQRTSARSESPQPASPRLQSVACIPADGDSVEVTFRAFSGARQDLDGRSWTKLCKDCHLIDKRLTATDADLIFARVVPSGHRRMDFAHFELALRHVAEKKAVDELSVRRAVAGSSGPTLNATKTENVRFHDDKSTYTGTHVHGGPEVGAKGLGTAALGSA